MPNVIPLQVQALTMTTTRSSEIADSYMVRANHLPQGAIGKRNWEVYVAFLERCGKRTQSLQINPVTYGVVISNVLFQTRA